MAQTPVELRDASLRLARILYFGFIFAACIQLFILSVVPISADPVDPIVLRVITALGVVDFLVFYFLCRHHRIQARQRLEANPADIRARGSFQVALILGLASTYSVFLFGFVLRFLGASLQQVLPLWVLALVGFAITFPKWPIHVDESTHAQGGNR